MTCVCSLATTWLKTHLFFLFNDTAPPEIYTLSLTTLFRSRCSSRRRRRRRRAPRGSRMPSKRAAGSRSTTERSEEHTSELQSHSDLVCRLLLEKKKKRSGRTE